MRRMRPSDIPAGLRLTAQANWNQTPADWQHLLTWEPDGCWVLDLDGRLVGTVTTTCYGAELAWVGMVLVDVTQRRQGFGHRLLLHALSHLEERGVGAVMLDATPLGQPLYEGLGFHEVYTLDRWQGMAISASAEPLPAQPLAPGDFSSAGRELDRRAFGLDRRRLLHDLQVAAGAKGFQTGNDDGTSGFVLLRPGAQRWHIGPLVAGDAESARGLLQAALAALAGQPVGLDVPRLPAAQNLVRRAGLEPVRQFVRMLRGGPPPAGDLALVYATAGPEIG